MKTRTKIILILIETLLVFFLGFSAGIKFERVGFNISMKLMSTLMIIALALAIFIVLYLYFKVRRAKKKDSDDNTLQE